MNLFDDPVHPVYIFYQRCFLKWTIVYYLYFSFHLHQQKSRLPYAVVLNRILAESVMSLANWKFYVSYQHSDFGWEFLNNCCSFRHLLLNQSCGVVSFSLWFKCTKFLVFYFCHNWFCDYRNEFRISLD